MCDLLPAGVTQREIDGPEAPLPWTWSEWANANPAKAEEFDQDYLEANGLALTEELEEEDKQALQHLRYALAAVVAGTDKTDDFRTTLKKHAGDRSAVKLFFAQWSRARDRHAEAQPR